MNNLYNKHNYLFGMSLVLEWHMPENVVDHMNDGLVHEILFHEKFIRGRATGTHDQRGSGTGEQALKHITLQLGSHKQV